VTGPSRTPDWPGVPTIRVLSLGAGVQSTTLALLAVEGVLPRPDAAIFADTGWEPQRVYDHLDRLAAVLADASVPLHRVPAGNLRDAVTFDAAIRKGGARDLPLNGEAFLHRSRVPLDMAPIDRITSHEWHDRQTNLIDQLADAEAGYNPDEDCDPDGCSPYGCRSGQPVGGTA